MLRKGYNWINKYATHPKAVWFLMAISFAESSFFPIPPDPLFIIMGLQRPQNAWKLAALCAGMSVLGGLLGYYIGYALYETIGEWIIHTYHLESAFRKFQTSFQEWGFWIIALKGLTPIPYKVVTIFSGVTHVDLRIFVAASIIARTFRFMMLATLLKYAGPQVQDFMDKNLGIFTSIIVFSLIAGILVIKYL